MRNQTKILDRIINDAKKKYTPYSILANICGVKREMRKFQSQFEAAAQACARDRIFGSKISWFC